MLGKLMKYEFKATGKMFLLFYAGLIFMSILNMLILPWGPTGDIDFLNSTNLTGGSIEIVTSVMQSLLFIMYILAAIAVSIVTFVAIVIRFYKLLGDEGYLMFTLPVKTSSHLVSKLLVSMVWFVSTSIVVVASIFIVIGDINIFSSISEAFKEASDMGLHPWAWVAFAIVAIILSGAVGILEFYLAIAIGPHITRSRLGGTIIGYIIVYAIVQVIGSVSVFALMIPFNNFEDPFMSSASMASSEWFLFSTVSIYVIALLLITAIPCYILTHHLIKNKLNLG